MPRFNGTGPRGQGPMTGRGMGRCRGGVGLAQRQRGLGRRFGFFRTRQITQEEKRNILKEEAEALKQELEEVKEEIADLEK